MMTAWATALDRWVIGLTVGLGVTIGGVLWRGDQGAARVREFNWQGQEVGAGDTALLLTFSRPMDRASVEENFRLDPPLAGKFSWAGRRMAYTLTEPIPYGAKTFTVEVSGARDRFSEVGEATMQPFRGQFQSRERALVYLGVSEEEASRLVLYNLTGQERQILTPQELVVLDFEPYPQGDRLLFSATDRQKFEAGEFDPKLYTVTTGMRYKPLDPLSRANQEQPTTLPPAGIVTQILDSDRYQNLKFDIAPDGRTLVVQRANKANPGADFGLWVITEGEMPQPLDTPPGGEFMIAPDSQSVVMAQGQGLAIVPLDSEFTDTSNPLDFLPQFGQILALAADGTQAAMVRFNTDYTRSLFWVNSQGQQRELWRTNGSILSATFSPTKTHLYVLGSRLVPGDTYQEAPFIFSIAIEAALAAPETDPPDPTGIRSLVRLETQRDITMSLAPDALAILFDQVTSRNGDSLADPRGSDGRPISQSQLWLLPLVPDTPSEATQTSPLPNPEPLPLQGIRPQWLP